MKATPLLGRRVADANGGFAEYVVWLLPKPLSPSKHLFKYRLAYVVNRECVIRHDNELGKGDHRHYGTKRAAIRLLDTAAARRGLRGRHSEVES